MIDRAFISVVSIGVGFLLAVFLSDLSAAHWFQFVENYQTLVTGLLALAAALWGVAHVRRQMAQQDRIHSEQLSLRDKEMVQERKLRQRKATATLPIDLSSLVTCARMNFDVVVLAANHINIDPRKTDGWRVDAFQLNDNQLERLIEITGIDDEYIADSVRRLLHFYQLMVSNTQGVIDEFERPAPNTGYVHSGSIRLAMKSIAEVWRRSEGLFSIARGVDFSESKTSTVDLRAFLHAKARSNPFWEKVLQENTRLMTD
tara:strand:- start:331 stop:1107 length:777 start_codon:yes stop_codon:yes gene_type:complete